MSNDSISLPDVAETGMLTFYCHVIESQSPDPILRDEKAVEISHQLSPVFANSSSRLLRSLAQGKIRRELVTHITLRAKKYDEYVTTFLKVNPDGVIVNIGCGMDSRFHRIDNGKVTFFDLDLPEMIEYKKQFYKETDRYHSDRCLGIRSCLDGPGGEDWEAPCPFHGRRRLYVPGWGKSKRPHPHFAGSIPGVRVGVRGCCDILYATTLEPDGGHENESTAGCG